WHISKKPSHAVNSRWSSRQRNRAPVAPPRMMRRPNDARHLKENKMRERAQVNWYHEGGFYGPDYMAMFADEAASGAAEAERALRLLALPMGSRVLDVACGYGRHAVNLAQRGLRVVGLDLNSYFLGVAAQRAADGNAAARF